MFTREQCLFSYCHAKIPGFDTVGLLEQVGLNAGEAVLLRQHYADALAGGARASQAFAVMSPVEREVLEQYDLLPIEELRTTLLNMVCPAQPPNAWKLCVKSPAELNGLLVWLLAFDESGVFISKIHSSTSEIHKPGSTVKMDVLLDLTRQLNLVELDGDVVTLSSSGRAYAEGGGAQGAERFELTQTRSEIILAAWRSGGNKAPLYIALNEALLAYARNPGEPPNSSATRWLKDLGVINQGYLSPLGVSMLHRLMTKLNDVTTTEGLTSMISFLEADLRLQLARLADHVNSLTDAATSTNIQAPSIAQPHVPSPVKVWEPKIPALETIFQPVPDERKLIEDAVSRLAVAGHVLSYEDLANLYICARSGRLTILAGARGVGKSSLVRRFTQSIGHLPSLKEVTVRRGWTDDQQFLGSVNRLHQRYDPAPTGVVHHLMVAELDEEAGLYWFLLDEFNLSTPEYYFAEFISVLEADAPEIRLYNPEDSNVATGSQYGPTIKMGNNVHFFGTINLDETAYVPSPRLIDRANFIWVERKIGLEVLQTGLLPPAKVGPILAKEYLQRKRPAALNAPTEKRFSEILSVLGQATKEYGTPHIVSPRAILGVASYVANSQNLLSDVDALDFAVSQRVLPGLRGIGDGFLNRMDALLDVLKTGGLKRSHRLLRRMIDAGSDRREFDFVSSLL